MKKVLLLCDVRAWAFDQNLRDLAEYLSDQFEFSISYVAEWFFAGGRTNHLMPDFDTYDVIYVPYHRWGIDHLLPWEKCLGSLRAQQLFPERKRDIGPEEIDLVNKFAAFHVVNKTSYEVFKPHCPRLFYLTNPVNTQRFVRPIEPIKELVASWTGNAAHTNASGEDVKGFYPVVVPACKMAKVKLQYAEYTACRLSPDEMPGFYQSGNVTLCASSYEGASNSILEAMSSGHAVIATDVGNHREMMESELEHYGDTGIVLVERSVAAFIEAINELKAQPDRITEMGRINREEIQRVWSWDVWAERYAEFLRSV